MTVYAQHGYAKADKIERGVREGYLRGVVLSPRDEQPARLTDYLGSLHDEFGDDITTLFDPQFYASTQPSPRDGYLPEYPYYEPGLTRGQFIDQARIRQYAERAIDYQAGLRLSRIIAPTVLINDFNGPWSQIALSLSLEAIKVHSSIPSAPPLYLSIVVDENSLKSKEGLDEFLNIVSGWGFHGAYVIVKQNDSTYPGLFEELPLARLLRLVYSLGLNGYEVVCGYCDLVGVLMRAVGATATCTGWFSSLRQFSLRRFQAVTGGSQPRPRYTSAPLLNSILVVPEMATIQEVGMLAQILSHTPHDSAFGAVASAGNVIWPLEVSSLHHWAVLAALSERVGGGESVEQNLEALESIIGEAQALYRVLSGLGVPFEPASGPRNLEVWRNAIELFRVEVGL